MSEEAKAKRPPLCGLTEDQVDALQAPLAQEYVATRENKFSYIEGHHAIREANRIFGPAGWTRETLSMACVYEGGYKQKGFQAAYIAKVRVTVRTEDGWVVREGTGYGDAIDYKSAAAVHEGASKEAETDAMKRAMMTLGDPFGLALYDKERKHVNDGSDDAPAPGSAKPLDADFDPNGYPLTTPALAAYMQETLGIDKADLGPMRGAAADRAWGGPPDDWKTLSAAQYVELGKALEAIVTDKEDA